MEGSVRGEQVGSLRWFARAGRTEDFERRARGWRRNQDRVQDICHGDDEAAGVETQKIKSRKVAMKGRDWRTARQEARYLQPGGITRSRPPFLRGVHERNFPEKND
jgi:hypothetical protein